DAVAAEQDEQHEGGRGEDREGDRHLPEGQGLLAGPLDRRRMAGGDRAHQASFAIRRRAPGVGSRKIARTSGGAAMNSTIRDCTTSTMSIGMSFAACMR